MNQPPNGPQPHPGGTPPNQFGPGGPQGVHGPQSFGPHGLQGYPGYGPGGGPQDPPKKKGLPLGLLIGGGAGALILILILAIAVPVMFRDKGKATIEEFFTALAESDAQTAASLTRDAGIYGITDEMLRRSNELAPISLDSVSKEEKGRYTVVFHLGPDEKRATVKVVEQYGGVQLDDVTTRVSFDVGDTFLSVSANGEHIIGSDQHLFPGVYELTARDNDYVVLDPAQMTVDLSEPSTTISPEILASDLGVEAAKQAISGKLEDCASYAGADTDGCPMKLDERGGHISGVTWALDPDDFDLQVTDESGTHYGGKVSFKASATYTWYSSDYRDRQEKTTNDTFSGEMYVDLSSGTTARVIN